MKISNSVGRNGINQSGDVKLVQQLLKKQNLYRLSIDGICGPGTIKGILDFQATFLKIPDGLVEPGGPTFRRLTSPPSMTTAAVYPAVGLTNLVQRPAPDTVNTGLRPVNNDYMLKLFGNPRDHYTTNCADVTNRRLSSQIKLADVGPFRVRGYSRAVDSLKAVMDDIQREQPTVYPFLGSNGMLCCRLQRGSKSAISNHSWGTAVDLLIDGRSDTYGDNRVQYGLTLIAPIFNRHKWYWGASFRKEDAMHFEVSRNLMEEWFG